MTHTTTPTAPREADPAEIAAGLIRRQRAALVDLVHNPSEISTTIGTLVDLERLGLILVPWESAPADRTTITATPLGRAVAACFSKET